MNAELVKQHPFLDERTVGTYAYFRVPKAMLTYGKTIGISTDETLLYSVLRDRIGLSLERGKIDDEGRIYIYYSREKAAACLGWSKRKAIDVFQSLTEHGLLTEQSEFSRTGKMLGKRLFVKLWRDVGFDFCLEDIKAGNFPYATIQTLNDTSMGSYYSLPVVLVEDERYKGLALRSILLYMIILDRLSLSKRYGRVDKNGLLWTTLDESIVENELGCSRRSLTRSFKELEDICLIERKAVEYAEKWRIYARNFAPPAINPNALPSPTPATPTYAEFDGTLGDEKLLLESEENIAPLCGQICTADAPNLHGYNAKYAPQCGQVFTPAAPNMHPSQLSYLQQSKNHLSEGTNLPPAAEPHAEAWTPSQREKKEAVMSAAKTVCYDDTMAIIEEKFKSAPKSAESAGELLDTCLQVIADDFLNPHPNILFGKNSVPKGDVLAAYRQLTPHIVYLLIEKTLPKMREIKNASSYLHWGLYTAYNHHSKAAFYLKQELGF